MTRPAQLLSPPREPAPLRAAATVLLLRDSAEGLEVLMTRRSSQASFAPNAYVFPGGGLDGADSEALALAACRATQLPPQRVFAMAAIRECFEELGVLLARHADGRPAHHATLQGLDRQAPLWPQCVRQGLTPAVDQLFMLAHWVTDRHLPRRFDVPFLVARMPADQTPVADGTEQFEPVWVRPAQALARHAEGRFFMIYPTLRTLERLQAFASVQDVLTACAGEQPLWHSCPRSGLLQGQEQHYMEHEAPYGELALVCPDGQFRHALDWQTEHAVGLLKNVQRLTAPNPGFMTGPGTNSYIVGTPGSGHIVIDPGPADAAHIERLWRAANGQIQAIVCTHSHPDHAPGAPVLQALCAAQGQRPAILGLPSAPTARADSAFRPDRALRDQETLRLAGAQADDVHTLRVLHTPGHAANHLCLLLEEDGLLFSGDHILNGSTTVINPPDGDMDDYMASLDKLDAACAAHGVDFILPAHGHVLGAARNAIAQLVQHRLQREAKVLAAMQACPQGTLQDWVALAYADVPERLWPVAQGSLAAHVARLNARLNARMA